MTLIMTVYGYGFTLQVSDRLVTRGGCVTFDQRANKTVIFTARDASITVSYTGTAFIDQLTTDTWIAQVLAAGDPTSGKVCPAASWPTLDAAISKLCECLSLAWGQETSAAKSAGLTIYGSGWRKIGKHNELVAFIVSQGSDGSFVCDWHDRPQRRTFRFMTSLTLPSHARERISRAFEHLESIRQAEDVLVGHIRATASTNNAVGRDCIAVCIPPIGDVTIRYHPADGETTTTVPVGKLPMRMHLRVYHSPWIIEPAILMPPLDMSGRWTSANPHLVRQYRFGFAGRMPAEFEPRFMAPARRPKRPVA